MISFRLGVEALANTRFAMSPLNETVCSLRALDDPGRYPLHAGWRRSALRALPPRDIRLLLTLVGHAHSLPDFLSPRPSTFAPEIEDELAVVRETPPDLVRRDLLLTHAPRPLPEPLRRLTAEPGEAPVRELVGTLCALLHRYWETAVLPYWPRMRLVLEADVTYRARLLATGGANGLFSGLHPNLRWREGELRISRMISRHRVTVTGGQGLRLMPTVFAYKPCGPVSPQEPPVVNYPSRGIATIWESGSESELGAGRSASASPAALLSLVGTARARLLALLTDPLPTVELARRLGVTPSAVSQHLKILHGTGLVTRVRDGRQVLYRRSELGDQLSAEPSAPARLM